MSQFGVMEFEGDFDVLVIRDFVTVAWAERDFSNGQVPCEHLVEMTT